jgi:hypothetical protein
MILTPRFTFIHLHKSGGTFVNQVLLKYVPGARQIGHHLPASQLPPSHADLPVLGVVRNPWDYYVSWFAFQRNHREYTWQVFSEGGKLGFEATTRRMLHAGEDDALIDRLIAQAPAEFTNRRSNLTKACIEGIRGRSYGWYTFLFWRMYGGLHVHFVRMENLREELLDFLRRMGMASEEIETFVRRAQRVNSTPHASYRTCYSKPLACLVGEREREVVARFGYTF